MTGPSGEQVYKGRKIEVYYYGDATYVLWLDGKSAHGFFNDVISGLARGREIIDIQEEKTI